MYIIYEARESWWNAISSTVLTPFSQRRFRPSRSKINTSEDLSLILVVTLTSVLRLNDPPVTSGLSGYLVVNFPVPSSPTPLPSLSRPLGAFRIVLPIDLPEHFTIFCHSSRPPTLPIVFGRLLRCHIFFISHAILESSGGVNNEGWFLGARFGGICSRSLQVDLCHEAWCSDRVAGGNDIQNRAGSKLSSQGSLGLRLSKGGTETHFISQNTMKVP
jgi:hypothetical protein